jgi:hypothetical protein
MGGFAAESNLDNGGEIEEKTKKDRALGKKSKGSKSHLSRIRI